MFFVKVFKKSEKIYFYVHISITSCIETKKMY